MCLYKDTAIFNSEKDFFDCYKLIEYLQFVIEPHSHIDHIVFYFSIVFYVTMWFLL
jgi:hypothetical protein